MIRRLLVANRGEIARRIIRACRELGIGSVAAYSEIDRHSLHVLEADDSVCIGPAAAVESYLSIPRLVKAARDTDVDAVHPGYGFLSENADFAQACEEAGLIFIGPPAEVLRSLGLKTEARQTMARAGLPIVPGIAPPTQDLAEFERAAGTLGFPLVLKAAGGGGGKGMRIVRDATTLPEAVDAARREASAAFGNGTLYVERLLQRPRHVEVQIFSDTRGNHVHLFERECSIQRRHQKIIEESPSPAMTPRLRSRMCDAACEAARTAGYRNAGTVEFLLEGTGDDAAFYFLEMNTRLQVEHPITEAVVGVDLVHAQLRVASGEPLPWRQNQLTQRGHAIECRIYAEDPAAGFLPQAGAIRLYREPAGAGVRVDSGVQAGSDVPVHYDPLLAKVTASGEDRSQAIRRAAQALREYVVLGVRTNVTFLQRVLQHDRFLAGDIDTHFVDDEREQLLRWPEPPAAAILAAAIQTARDGRGLPSLESPGASRVLDPWDDSQRWRPFEGKR